MKFIGLIRAHHINETEFIRRNNIFLTKYEIEKIIKHLNNRGQKFAVSLTVINSLISGESIGTLSYFTDGYWIWPSYFPHYLSRNSIDIPLEFIEEILDLDQMKLDDSDINLSIAIQFYKANFETYLAHAKN